MLAMEANAALKLVCYFGILKLPNFTFLGIMSYIVSALKLLQTATERLFQLF